MGNDSSYVTQQQWCSVQLEHIQIDDMSQILFFLQRLLIYYIIARQINIIIKNYVNLIIPIIRKEFVTILMVCERARALECYFGGGYSSISISRDHGKFLASI